MSAERTTVHPGRTSVDGECPVILAVLEMAPAIARMGPIHCAAV